MCLKDFIMICVKVGSDFENQCGLKGVKRSLLLTICDFMFFSIPRSPCKNLLLQQLFIGSAHVEQCSNFVLELLENKNRITSDVICQFYG